MVAADLPRIVAILGTNASGKSELAVRLAEQFGGEIVSADSRQVYRGLDVGTGKLRGDEMRGVPHHLIDVANLDSEFSLAHYQRLAYTTIDAILDRSHLPLLVGGTGLYLRAVVEGYELVDAPPDPDFRRRLGSKSTTELLDMLRRLSPVAAKRVESTNRRRIIRALEVQNSGVDDRLMKRAEPRYRTLQLGLTWNTEILHQRIERRLAKRLGGGLVEEVRGLIDAGHPDERIDALGLEYRHVLRYLRGGHATEEELFQNLSVAIKQFARRQLAWFRRDKDVTWLDSDGDYFAEARERIGRFIQES